MGKQHWLKILLSRMQSIRCQAILYGCLLKINHYIEPGLQHVKFQQGLPKDIDTTFDPSIRNLVIIDDLMTEAHSDQQMTKLFSVWKSS